MSSSFVDGVRFSTRFDEIGDVQRESPIISRWPGLFKGLAGSLCRPSRLLLRLLDSRCVEMRMRTVERRYKEFAALRKQARQWPRQ